MWNKKIMNQNDSLYKKSHFNRLGEFSTLSPESFKTFVACYLKES